MLGPRSPLENKLIPTRPDPSHVLEKLQHGRIGDVDTHQLITVQKSLPDNLGRS